MSIERDLHKRSGSACELCGRTDDLKAYHVPPEGTEHIDRSILTCTTCQDQIIHPDKADPNHWRCLNDSMWSAVPAIQVVSWRMLHRLKSEGWPADLLDMLFLDEETLVWAQATGEDIDADAIIKHKDSNGAILEAGDTITLIKDLNVKGANFMAKRGTAVRNIRLVHDNPEHIEGKVNGQQIVILTQFVKKSK